MRTRVAVAAVLLVAVAIVLVFPRHLDTALIGAVDRLLPESARIPTAPPYDRSFYIVEDVLNILLFIPLAFAIGFATGRWWLGFVLAAALSAGGELIQIVIPGRFPSIQDFALNAIGSLIGAGIAAAVNRRRRLRRLSGGAGDGGAAGGRSSRRRARQPR
ncbi:VanZ family protein [Amnibacterium sp.]|uniref:VanZ family protein n=1 Tax=Amnibacterium sp. TaxID=1872496 RepID=UPI00260B0402|nr:VanZ family protein [Amnibacterium sp.]MCU1472289.1 VanZ family protein [Amnibacterium sp.]